MLSLLNPKNFENLTPSNPGTKVAPYRDLKNRRKYVTPMICLSVPLQLLLNIPMTTPPSSRTSSAKWKKCLYRQPVWIKTDGISNPNSFQLYLECALSLKRL